MGYEFVGCQYVPQGKHVLLRIFIDTAQGITVDDCAKVSYQVGAILDVEDVIRGQYTLEVSSPGLDRPLFTPAHFERFIGHQANVRVHTPLEGRRNFRGEIMALAGGQLTLKVDEQDVVLPFDDIDKASLVPELPK
jgi:ribosome maturation factor RimP